MKGSNVTVFHLWKAHIYVIHTQCMQIIALARTTLFTYTCHPKCIYATIPLVKLFVFVMIQYMPMFLSIYIIQYVLLLYMHYS
jgi:hypothetical protein